MVELRWDGKYKDGKKVAPVRIALPFQTIETVNESAQDRQKMLDFFSDGKDSEWRNRLIWGDKKYVLPSLLEEFAGKVNLIYIDPPFATGADFSFTAQVPDDPDTDGEQGATFVKEPSILEQKAYRDTWGRGLDSYIHWMFETLSVLRDLLTEDGTIYVHVDWRVNSHIRLLMDEIFGPDNHLNQIVWRRSTPTGGKTKSKMFPRDYDVIISYGKSQEPFFENTYLPYSADYIENFFNYRDPNGRRFMSQTLGDYSEESIRRFESEGRIFVTKTGTKRLKYYLDEAKGILADDIWTDIRNVRQEAVRKISNSDSEIVNYPTQKPEALLKRILETSTKQGDLVLDCFCGSGTTAAVAEKLGRRWITCDLGRFAIHTARKRFLGIPNVKPFTLQNLGKYERQAWQAAEFATPEDARLREARYRKFILDLYRAEPITSGAWLHGVKLGRMVHVGAVDAPVTLEDVKAIARETWKRVGSGEDAPETSGVDILGWDFAFELNELGMQVAREAGVDVKFKKIPREVLEKKAVDQGDIKFFELAALTVASKADKKKVTLELKDFIISPDDVPAEVMQAVTHWSQWVDYWAVDWDFKGDTFHNQWQSYRTKKVGRLELKANHAYEAPGEYTVLVKVIDLLGNDTTKALTVKTS